jgi:hypothetical protein
MIFHRAILLKSQKIKTIMFLSILIIRKQITYENFYKLLGFEGYAIRFAVLHFLYKAF